jgi:hypothetical protein
MVAAGLMLAVAACAAPPPVSTPIELAAAPKTIALPRLVFSDNRPDPFCDLDAAARIYSWVRRELEEKGYRVVPARFPALENSNRPDPWATAAAAEVLGYLPETADALLRVRIDHYLAIDFCPREELTIFEVAGVAELFAAGRPGAVWRSSAAADLVSRNGATDAVFIVGGRFAEALIAPLPSAP